MTGAVGGGGQFGGMLGLSLRRRFAGFAGAAACVALCAGSLALVPGAAGAQTPAPAASADAEHGFERAQSLFHERKYGEAVAALTAFLAAHPRDARALVLRGDCRADQGDNEGALKDYNTAIAIAPEYEYAYVTRCGTRLQLDDDTGALADCDNAVRLDATDPLAFEDRGDVQFQRDAYELALADYDKAISLGRTSAYIYAARCDAERLVGKRDRAKPDCEKALEIDPKSRRGLWARSRLALVETRYIDGIADLNAYIAQSPKESDTAYYYRGLAYNRIGKFTLALEDLRTYVQRRPTDPDGYKERAIASFGVGDKASALADLDLAQRGYRKDGDTSSADHIAAMVKAISDGKAPTP
jgi:tetratricopeptide (TPR) repeat protein